MADMVTKQELEAAKIDVKHAGEAVNEKKIINPRYGDSFKSLPLAIQEVIETGGFEPFATEAQLKASVPLLTKKAAKALDTKKIWLWENGAWVDTGLSELDQAKEYANNEISTLDANVNSAIDNIKKNLYVEVSTDDLMYFTDSDDNIIALIDNKGLLHVVGLDQPIQTKVSDLSTNVTSLKNTTYTYADSEAFIFADTDGNILAKIGLDGKFYIVGLDIDLVTYIQNKSGGGDSIKDTSLAETRSYKDTFAYPVQTLLNTLMYGQTGLKAPAPMHLFQHNFTTNKTWINDINQITFDNSTRLEIESPYRNDDGVCHPNIIEFYNGFRGYRYIIAITPYYLTNEAEENPCIYGSNDLINFDLLDGFDQPLDVRPIPDYSTGHNSDNVLTYDPKTGELICIWRQTLRNPNNDGVRTDCLWMRKTKDGYSWSEKQRIFVNTKNTESGGAGSPAILYDVKSNYWYMYVTRLGPNSTDLRLFKAAKLNEDAWEYVSQISTPFVPWHQEVKFIGDKVVMLVYCYPPDNTLYFGIADDFQNFTWSANKYGETSCYKSSFVPEINDQNEISLKILYSTDAQPTTTSEKWRMYMHQTNFISANLELK